MSASDTDTTINNFSGFDLSTRDAAIESIQKTNSMPGLKSETSMITPLVAVLLCTHHGDRFLTEQLDSIRTQQHKNITVWASDDGSEDNTPQILKKYQSIWKKDNFSIHSGPQKGFVANFLSVICQADIDADYFAYADQDDIWEADKLSRAIARLKNISSETPALYCSRTSLIDDNGNNTGFTPLFSKPPSFANALIQNISSGNTVVMNKAARNLLRTAGEKTVVNHDWWTYMLIAGAGGTVIYDPYPSIRYRQHDNNLVSSNTGWRSRMRRIRLRFKNRFRHWNTINTQALQQVRHLLTPENQDILDKFCTARNSWLLPRLWGIWRSGIYRQSLFGNLGLIAEAALKKL